MLLIAALPMALLAGSTTQEAFLNGIDRETRMRCRRVLIQIVLAAAVLTGGFAIRLIRQGETPRPHVYWLSLLLTLPAVWLLLRNGPSLPDHAGGQVLGGLILATRSVGIGLTAS